MPALSYVDQFVPRSIFMRKQKSAYDYSLLFRDVPGPYAEENLHDLDFMNVEEYMSTVEASRNVYNIRRYVTKEPSKPTEASATAESNKKTRRASDKSYRDDPVTGHDVRSRDDIFSKTISHLRNLMAKAARFQKDYVKSWNPSVDEVSKLMYPRQSS